jgi:uncharacterized protein
MDQPDQEKPPGVAPLAAPDRLIAIDILRGIALFGVMAINVVFEFRVSIFQQFLGSDRAASPLDAAITSFLDHAIAMKAFALFSLLFGIGLAIQFERIDPNKRPRLLTRRLLVLLAFGVVHLTLIWNGDILTEYALAGLLALPFLFGPQWLLGAGSAASLGLYFSGALNRLVPLADPASMKRQILEATHVYGSGSFSDILAFRIHEIGMIAPLHLWIFPRTLGLFLLGGFIWRTGLLRRGTEHARWLLLAGFAALVASIDAGRELAPVTLALAYACLVIGAASTRRGASLLGWAAPLGRMAFTNYLMQSLIFGVVFYHYGLGLFGRLSVSAALGLGIVVYVMQGMMSIWWLTRFAFGPVEWLWRSLMYGRMQPMRRSSPAPCIRAAIS